MGIIRGLGKHPLFIVLLCAIVPRLLFLDRIPSGLSNDEIDFVINAKMLFLTGTGVTGQFAPTNIGPFQPHAELSSVLIAPFIGVLPFSLLAARLPFALLGVATIVLLYKLTEVLIHRRYALFVGIAASLNPWNIFFSRTLYDAPVTTFFLLLSLSFLITLKEKKLYLTIFPLLLAFHAYLGMMTLFPFFVLIALYYGWRCTHNKHSNREFLILGSVSLLMVLRFFGSSVLNSTHPRVGELFTPVAPSIRVAVDNERRLSVENPLTPLVSNKLAVYLREQLTKYMNAFSPDLLFLHGDHKHIFTIFTHGLFYPTDIIFILIGGVTLFLKHRRVFYLLLSLLLVAPIPTLASNLGASYASRSYFMQPIFLITIGVGLSVFIDWGQKITRTRIYMIIFCIVIGLEAGYFGYLYFLRNPIYNSESYAVSGRVLALYIKQEREMNRPVVVLSIDPTTSIKQYLFYTNGLTSDSAKELRATYESKSLRLNSVSTGVCPPVGYDAVNTTLVIEGDNPCLTFTPSGVPMTIAQLSDGGSVYSIFNGKSCREEVLERYPHNISWDDLDIDSLSNSEFCKTYITRY